MQNSFVSYLLCPLWEVPFGADKSVGVQDAIYHLPVNHIRPNDALIHGIRILPPRRLRHSLPRVTAKNKQFGMKTNFCVPF